MDKKAPPTEEMLLYIEADKAEKEASAIKERLRPVILQQHKESGLKYQDITYRTQVTNPIDEEKFFNWVKKTWPDKVESLKQDRICPLKFKKAFLKGEIDYDHLPEYIYTERITDVITVKRRKNETSQT